mgnify:CR=1 FL=1
MKSAVFLTAAVLLLSCCEDVNNRNSDDTRFVVLGPSLVELMFVSGLGGRIVGIDRFSNWPEQTENLPQVGGYIDPSIEKIVSLDPTSIHISGESAVLRELAATLGIPFYSYRFDNLEDVFCSIDSLDARYGSEAAGFRVELDGKLDSLKTVMANTAPVSAMIVIYHSKGSSSMTVAGRNSYFADLLSSFDCEISAPRTGSWPLISAEGVIDLSPDHIICLYPDRTDTADITASEEEYFSGLGFAGDRVHCLFEPYLTIPGGRIGATAERICSCLL